MGHVDEEPRRAYEREPRSSVPGQRPAPPWVSDSLAGGAASSSSGAVGSSETAQRAMQLVAAFATETAQASATAQVVAMRTMIDQLEALWLDSVADLDASGAVADAGFGSLTSWLRYTCRLAPGEASGRASVAVKVAAEHGVIDEAMRTGAVSWRHAQVIDAALSHLPLEHRDEAEASLVEHAKKLDPGQLRRVADRLIHCFDRELADDAAIRKLDRRGLSVGETMDGMVSIHGLLDPVTGSLLLTALATKMQPLRVADHGDGHPTGISSVDSDAVVDEVRTWSQRRADALGEICQQWLEDINTTQMGGLRPHMSVIVDHATLAAPKGDTRSAGAEPGQLAWVGPITATEAQMIGCDSTVSRIVTDGQSQILDVGRATRTIPPALRRAVAVRDRSCIGPGCDRSPERCDVHHIVFWEHGGSTSLENTVLLCRRHHGLVHLKQWRVVVEPNGTRRLSPP